MSETAKPSITEVRARLDEIAATVADESIDLEEALALYEEAVTLGLAACELSTSELALDDEKPAAESAAAPASAAASDEAAAQD